MRNIKKAINEYRKVIATNPRKDFTRNEYAELMNISKDMWDAIFNASMFGFTIGYRFAISEREKKNGKNE